MGDCDAMDVIDKLNEEFDVVVNENNKLKIEIEKLKEDLKYAGYESIHYKIRYYGNINDDDDDYDDEGLHYKISNDCDGYYKCDIDDYTDDEELREYLYCKLIYRYMQNPS
jgi:regulator of replication initiation timing